MQTQAVEKGGWGSKNREAKSAETSLFGKTDCPLTSHFRAAAQAGSSPVVATGGQAWVLGERPAFIVSFRLLYSNGRRPCLRDKASNKDRLDGLGARAASLPQAPATCCSSVGVGLWVGVFLFWSLL